MKHRPQLALKRRELDNRCLLPRGIARKNHYNQRFRFNRVPFGFLASKPSSATFPLNEEPNSRPQHRLSRSVRGLSTELCRAVKRALIERPLTWRSRSGLHMAVGALSEELLRMVPSLISTIFTSIRHRSIQIERNKT